MSRERHKQLASELFARFSAGDVAGVLDMMTDDATWRLPGKPGQMPVMGVRRKDQITRVFHGMLGQLKSGLRMTVQHMIAEGDTVAVEVVSHGELKNGRVYDQEYHFAITFRDGRIAAVREYLDTQHAFATWFQP